MRAFLLALVISGCGVDGPPVGEAAAASIAVSRTDFARGSFTCDFGIAPGVPFDLLAPQIERDRMYMAAQPGMQNKHLPLGVDAAGNLFSGGRYLFDTRAQAAAYHDFVAHRFVLDGV